MVNSPQIDLLIQSNPSKNSNRLFCRNQKHDFKIYIERQRTRIAKMAKKTNKAGDRYSLIADLLFSYGNQTVWYWHKDKHIDEQKGVEGSEIDPHIYS